MGELAPLRPARLAWPDTYRGLVIILIVAVHTAKAMLPFGFPVEGVAVAISDLQFVGMAAFFAISGMNSRKYIDGPTALFWGGRAFPLLYLLVMWALLFPLLTTAADGHWLGLTGAAVAVGRALIHPFGYLWFVWSLLIYSVLVRVVARRAPSASLVVAAIITFVALGLDPDFWYRHPLPVFNELSFIARRALGYILFFLLGYRYREQIVAVSRGPLLLILVPSIAASFYLPIVAADTSTNLIGAPLRIASLFLALVGSIYLGRALAVLPGIGDGLRWLGRLTLPIYLVHPVVVVITSKLVDRSYNPWFHAHPMATLVAITVIGVIGGIAVAAAAPRLHFMWVFRPPTMRRPTSWRPWRRRSATVAD